MMPQVQERASILLNKFEKNPRMIERAVFRNFWLQIPINKYKYRVNFKGQKRAVPDIYS